MSVGGCRGLIPQSHRVLFLLHEQRVQPPRLVLCSVTTQERHLAERRLWPCVDDDYRHVVCQRKLPRRITRIEIGSIARDALWAWILDDTSFRGWRNADRPTVYLAVAELMRATDRDELKGLEWPGAMLRYANSIVCASPTPGQLAEVILKEAEESAAREDVQPSVPHPSRLWGRARFERFELTIA